MYELMGRAHAALIRGERGQGTVEYVGLILLIAVVLTAVVAAGSKNSGTDIASTIVNKLKGAIDGVSAPQKP
jgi:Flp pilus assembly pilin Flp